MEHKRVVQVHPSLKGTPTLRRLATLCSTVQIHHARVMPRASSKRPKTIKEETEKKKKKQQRRQGVNI